jgi:hypothetical protein
MRNFRILNELLHTNFNFNEKHKFVEHAYLLLPTLAFAFVWFTFLIELV